MRVGVLSVAIGMCGLFGVFALLPITAYLRLGLDPVLTGILMLPGGLLMGLLAPIAGRAAERAPAWALAAGGFITMAIASAGFACLGPGDALGLLALHILLSIGFAATVSPLYTKALSGQPDARVPHASALLSVVQQVAGAAGTVGIVAVAQRSNGLAFMVAAGLLAIAAATQIVSSRASRPPRREMADR
jgi:DHA2 family lincomycin resistance protein-like MFS transporter